jgi:hypothetical protein
MLNKYRVETNEKRYILNVMPYQRSLRDRNMPLCRCQEITTVNIKPAVILFKFVSLLRDLTLIQVSIESLRNDRNAMTVIDGHTSIT